MRLNCSWALKGLAVAGLLVASAAQAAIPETVYYTPAHGTLATYLLSEPSTGRAKVTDPQGNYRGSLTDDGTLRVVSFDTPPSTISTLFPDSCGNPYQLSRQVNQLAFRQVAGTLRAGEAAVIEVGVETVLDGCDAGTTTPFGSLSDAGFPVAYRTMNNRAPMTDVVAGAQFAGFVESAVNPDVPFPTQDIGTLLAGNQLRFETTGTVVPAAIDAKGWLVLSMPGFQRGFTRLVVDKSTGAETWLEAEFVSGKPATIKERLFTKPLAGAGFGSRSAAARIWESGLFVGTNNPFFFWLYRDFTGERVSQTIDPPTEVRQPITWAFDGLNIVQTRTPPDGSVRTRTWKPIANVGKNRWVMESEQILFPDGQLVDLILPRVNFYVDRGAATPPTARKAQKQPAKAAERGAAPRPGQPARALD